MPGQSGAASFAIGPRVAWLVLVLAGTASGGPPWAGPIAGGPQTEALRTTEDTFPPGTWIGDRVIADPAQSSDGSFPSDAEIVVDDGSAQPLADPRELSQVAGDFSPRVRPLPTWFDRVSVGYDDGFVIASRGPDDLDSQLAPYLLRINGWGQLRRTFFESANENPDLDQFQLKRGRLVLSGHAFTPDFSYFLQIDARSTSGDDIRMLDYYVNYDLGHHFWDAKAGALTFEAGRFKVPFNLARWLTAREFQFADRSVASMFFDVNRSIGWKFSGNLPETTQPWHWSVSTFNGLVTGGAETGASEQLDDNPAYSARFWGYPIGQWGSSELSDFEWHEQIATRVGCGFATSSISRRGRTEFSELTVVDSGLPLGNILPHSVDQYTTYQYCMDGSLKYRGWSATLEYYFRYINQFEGGHSSIPGLFDQGFWLQFGRFIVPERVELIARWSRVQGDSGTLGLRNQSADEVAGAFAWYSRRQNAKLVCDLTHINGAPIESSALDMQPGDNGWFFRMQLQYAF